MSTPKIFLQFNFSLAIRTAKQPRDISPKFREKGQSESGEVMEVA